MKNIFSFLILILVIAVQNTCSQTCLWADTATFSYSTWAIASKTDSLGNVYIIGGFENRTYPSPASNDPIGTFLRKYDKNGNLEWTKLFKEVYIEMLFIKKGKIIVSGRFWGTDVNFDNYLPHTKQGGFILTINENGVIQHFKEYPNACFLKGEINSQDDLIISGIFYTDWGAGAYVNDTLNLDGHILVNHSSNSEFFSTRFDSTLTCTWAIQSTGAHLTTSWGFDMDVNDYGIYSCGNYIGTFKLNDSISITNNGSSNGFIVKFDFNGAIKWIKNIGSSNNGPSQEAATSITADNIGNVYVTWWNDGPLNIDNYNLDPGNYMAKLDSLGNFLWIKNSMGKMKCYRDTLYILSGGMAGTVHGNVTVPSTGSCLLKADTSGTPFWLWQAPGGANHMGFSATPDESGNIYLAGSYSEEIDLGNGHSFDGWRKMFVAKLGTPAPIGIFENTGEQKKNIEIFPNPFSGSFYLKIYLSERDALHLKVMDVSGKMVYEERLKEFEGEMNKRIELKQAGGIYFLQATGNKNHFSEKIILNH